MRGIILTWRILRTPPLLWLAGVVVVFWIESRWRTRMRREGVGDEDEDEEGCGTREGEMDVWVESGCIL